MSAAGGWLSKGEGQVTQQHLKEKEGRRDRMWFNAYRLTL